MNGEKGQNSVKQWNIMVRNGETELCKTAKL